MTQEEMTKIFEDAMHKFIQDRRIHGGIMLPDDIIINNSYHEARMRVGLDQRLKEIPVIGKKK